MATITVTNDDTTETFSTLAACLSDADTATGHTITITTSGTGAADDTSAATISDTNLTIQTSGQAACDGHYDGGPMYQLTVSGSHALTVGSSGCTIDGLVIQQTGTGASDEAIRANASVTVQNCVLWADSQDNQQDGIYTSTDGVTITAIQCFIFGFFRGGIHFQGLSAGDAVTINANSCGIWDCGDDDESLDEAPGGIGVAVRPSDSATVNVQNTWAIDNDAGTNAADYNESVNGGTATWNISNSCDSDGSIAGLGPDAGSGNTGSCTIVESAGAGSFEVIVNDITTQPYDLRLVDNANNDAQDAHANATAHSLTIPSTDIAGTSRPVNTNYDIGPYEVPAAGGATNPKGPLGMALQGPFGGPI